MPTTTYYLNGPTLGSSTTIFLNSSLTTIAPDGFYSDGVTSREQVSGVLLPPSVCNSCGVPCGETISATGATGVYLLNLDSGSTPSDIGAIIVRFSPASVPDGIRVTYNGNVYNALTSQVDGFHQSTDPNGFTIVGSTTAVASCGSWYPAGATLSLNEFLYDGTSFNPTGSTQSITISPGDISLSLSAPGSCLMVIPKTSAAPNILNFEFIGPCGSTVWGIETFCPLLLTGFSSSIRTASADCFIALTQTYYNASLASTPGTVKLYDFVFSDAFGANPLAAGFYRATGSIFGGADYFEVDANGVVISTGFC